jgi:NAD(P)-dependent dehydrogenase (short-subunit alcohol dehydrogenase family)
LEVFFLENKTVVITGGASGIGKACALRFIEHGWNVYICDIDYENGLQTAEELSCKGKIRFLKVDVSDEKDIIKMFTEINIDSHSIDCIVNSAARTDFERTDFEKLTLSEWNSFIQVNLTGTFLVSRHAVPYLKKSKGCIINMSSTRAYMSEKNTEGYSASKGGVVALTHAMAVSLGPDIRVNSISPGWINTKNEKITEKDNEFHICGRVGKPEDIASMVYYLAGEQSGFITGQDFVVDGGITKKMIY